MLHEHCSGDHQSVVPNTSYCCVVFPLGRFHVKTLSFHDSGAPVFCITWWTGTKSVTRTVYFLKMSRVICMTRYYVPRNIIMCSSALTCIFKVFSITSRVGKWLDDWASISLPTRCGCIGIFYAQWNYATAMLNPCWKWQHKKKSSLKTVWEKHFY